MSIIRTGHAAALLLACACTSTNPSTPPAASEGSSSDGGSSDGSSSDGSSSPSDDTSTGGDAPAPIEWQGCPDGFSSECAWIDVPLDWDDPDGETITTFLARATPSTSPPRAQLWLVMGGPGDSSEIFDQQGLIGILGLLAPDLEIMTFEHRGVGESTRLQCPSLEDPTPGQFGEIPDPLVPECLAQLQERWGDGLRHFSSTQAARDLAYLIEATTAEQTPVFLYGVSYGTLLVQRFLQLRPERPAGVILDSVYSPGVQWLDRYDQQWDPVAQRIAEACDANTECSARFGAPAWESTTATFDAVSRGHCADAGLDAAALGRLAFTMIDSGSLRELWLPLLHRLDRCGPADLIAIGHLRRALASLDAGGSPRASDMLRTQVVLTEEWTDPPPSLAEVEARCVEAVVCPRVATRVAEFEPIWPVYRDEYWGMWPDTDVPLLAMNGTWDAKTPVETARAAGDHYGGPYQHFVELPGVTHAVIANSFTSDGALLPCGLTLMLGFVDDPTAPLDDACVDLVEPFDPTASDPALANAFFGTADPWDG
ncbi:MAG: alpha/beta fold hydrolase [Nannocystaceae bacterium]